MEYSVKLYESSDTYRELIQATAADRRIPAVYVEKDYWVTRVLKRLHESAFSETVVFKGGTSLSKAHRLIERFRRTSTWHCGGTTTSAARRTES